MTEIYIHKHCIVYMRLQKSTQNLRTLIKNKFTFVVTLQALEYLPYM